MNIFSIIAFFISIVLGTLLFFLNRKIKKLNAIVKELQWKMDEAFGFTQDNIPD